MANTYVRCLSVTFARCANKIIAIAVVLACHTDQCPGHDVKQYRRGHVTLTSKKIALCSNAFAMLEKTI